MASLEDFPPLDNREEGGSRPSETASAGISSPEFTAGERGSNCPSPTQPHQLIASAERKPSGRVIRLSNIPSTVQASQFIDAIKGVAQGSQFDELPWSLCPDATTEYQERYNVATVTLKEVPQLIFRGGYGTVRSKHGTFYFDEGFLGMTPLASPPQEDTTVDIIAVPGLAGHAFGSWCSHTEPSMWLRDFLPEFVPSARILIYGYDSKLNGSTSIASIFEFAKQFLDAIKTIRGPMISQRPLILIGHNIGGLVIKQALVDAAQGSKEDKDIFNATYGLIFFGTPTRGLEIQDLSAIVKGQPNEELIKYLGASSRYLKQQHDEFYRVFTHHDSQIISVFETQMTPTVEMRDGVLQRTGPPVVMVPQSAAVHHSKYDQSHEIFSIDASNPDLVRFSTPVDPDYKAVQKWIKTMVECAPGVIRERLLRQACGSNASYRLPPKLRFEVNHNFTGRIGELSEMRKRLRNDQPGEHMQRRLVLHGLGGIGKTQLAIQYAHKHLDDYTSVWTVNCATKETCSNSFLDIAEELLAHYAKDKSYQGLDRLPNCLAEIPRGSSPPVSVVQVGKTVEAVKRWFCLRDNRNWLLILDNIDDLEAWDAKTIPSASHGTIILTSRRRDLIRLGAALEVKEMNEEDSISLLLSSARAGRDAPFTSEDENCARRLVKTLGYLPLALDQAGAYIAACSTVEKYSRLCQKQFTRIFEDKPIVWSYEDKTVFTTWKISLDAIRNKEPKSADLFLLFSFFSNEDISEEMLRRGMGLEEDDLDLDDCLKPLLSHSLVTRKGALDSFYIHSVVHQWAREHLAYQERRDHTIKALLFVEDALACSPRIPEQWSFERRIIPHIFAVLKHHQKYTSDFEGLDDVSAISNSLVSISHSLCYQGHWNDAERLDMQVMEMRKRSLGQEHPDTLTSMAKLASTYRNQGLWKEAERLEAQVMETRERVLGREHPDTLSSMANLAATFWNQGRWEEAEGLEVQVMETSLRVLGQEHPNALGSMANLAATFRNQGRWKEAEELQLQVMGTSLNVLGQEHPDTLASMANLASTFWTQGRWKEAERLEVQVMETSLRVLGREHPDTLSSMANLASTYRNQGLWNEAERLEVQAMETRNRVLGQEHPDTLSSTANLASTFWHQGRWKEAERLQLQVMETRMRVLGEEHPDTLTSLANLSSTFRKQGRWKEAEELEVQVMETNLRVLGQEHPNTLTSVSNLAATFWNQGRWKEAERLQLQVMETRMRVLGQEHPNTLSSIANLAATFWIQGRWKEAEGLQLQAMETSLRVLGQEHPNTLSSMANLAAIFWNQGRWKEAEELWAEALQKAKEVLGPEHPDTLRYARNLKSPQLSVSVRRPML